MTFNEDGMRNLARALFGGDREADDSVVGQKPATGHSSNHVPREGGSPSSRTTDEDKRFAGYLFGNNDDGTYQEQPSNWEPPPTIYV